MHIALEFADSLACNHLEILSTFQSKEHFLAHPQTAFEKPQEVQLGVGFMNLLFHLEKGLIPFPEKCVPFHFAYHKLTM